jgi:ribonuclease HI
MAQKYYAVKKGRKIGVFSTWEETNKSVSKYSGAIYKSFPTLKEAENFLTGLSIPANSQSILIDENSIIAYVDGSFNGASIYGSGVVLLDHLAEIVATFSFSGNAPEFILSYQIAGECLSCLKAIEWAIEHKYQKIFVHYDYLGIEKWATSEWQANKPISKFYAQQYAILASKIEIIFIKEKAHSGVEYNELADKLAKKAIGIV